VTDERPALPPALRAQLASGYAPVRPLPSPSMRALWVLPFAVLSLVAAQAFFQLRVDAPRLGWSGTWGLSLAQVGVGLVLVAAALKEAVPGRGWTGTAAVLWLVLPLVLLVGVTYTSWDLSPVRLRGQWFLVSGMCLAGSAVSALPVVALASILAARAYPTRPLFAGALLGLGAGLMADAGWRLFCHFSEPAHVLAAHLGSVLVCVALGSAVASRLSR
jgi:Negative regulator of sigma F